jgi:hypothetical protein
MKPITPQSTEKLPKNIIKLLKDIEGWNKGSIKLAHYVQETVRQSMLEALKAQRQKFIELVESKMINKQVISLDEFGYNEALEDLLKKLKEL